MYTVLATHANRNMYSVASVSLNIIVAVFINKSYVHVLYTTKGNYLFGVTINNDQSKPLFNMQPCTM